MYGRCIFLGLLIVIIRLVRRDITRYNSKDNSEDIPPECGWILVRRDALQISEDAYEFLALDIFLIIQVFSIAVSTLCK